ncbi:hypothetical protein FVEN_g9796 [Fusarium venenatum]|uniref:Bacteriophage T5 Orf172 DNA-binding domain-containing protein n=1 Tax=Fusarium venenatum TaxID=56646 RepID=A0A2L2TY67_9HYPO|nr:uncharacterized protein FVRRES_03532 [Fusarium venenatum]KAG8352065.1 hypothetical protein FVEN_g9796 [Fusarium venenatum]KAH7003449.1 hypothetical protein EDB82DRAFT_16914 [Fusarium venenatum]CEI67020.1 unnamed protein product [Fusarium venenatum]
MATPQASEHFLFTWLRELIVFFPKSEENSDFEKCRWRTKSNNRCRRERTGVVDEAIALWLDIEKTKTCPDIAIFYPKVEQLLQLVYCGQHFKFALPLFQEWKEKHGMDANLTQAPSGAQEPNRVLIEDSDDTSQPGTPEPEVFDLSCLSDTSPFPTPLTEADSVRTPIEGPARILDSSIPDTSSGAVSKTPSSVANNNSNINTITKDISTLSLGHTYSTSDRSPVNDKQAYAESISKDDELSFQGISERLSVIPDRKPVAEQTASDVIARQENTLEVEDDPLDHPINLEGIGIGRLYRQGTLKRGSPILKALTTPPTLRLRKHGVVYVLQHTKNEKVFKIGYTGHNAVNRQNQPGNCYGKNTKVIYESETDFVGAEKAEHLAHIFLGNHNLKVPECASCGGGHKEWYYDQTGDVLIATLKVMEDFVQLPAYELKAGQKEDGEMVVSQEAEKRIKSMFDISIQGLQGSVGTQNGPASIQMDSTIAQTAVPQAMDDVPIKSTEAEPLKTSESSAGATVGRFMGSAKEKVGKWRNIRDSFSREGTPESSDSREPPGEGEKFFATFLWTLGGGRHGGASKGGESPRGWSALIQAMTLRKNKFKEGFATGKREAEMAS